MNNQKTKKCLTAEENALFCNQIVMLLKAGIPLHEGMRTLCETYRGTRYEECFSKIDRNIRETGSLAEAVASAEMFSGHVTHMIHVGEQAGILEEVLEALDEYYLREAQVRRAVKNAVLYPLILVAMMAVVIGILSIRVMPIFTRVYNSLGVEASKSAETMIRFGSVIGQIVLAAVAVLLCVVIVLFILYQTRQKEKVKLFLLKLFPSAKRISRNISIARFSAVFSKLLEGGFPVEEAISLVVGIVPDHEIAAKVLEGREAILKGKNFVEAITETGIYNRLYIQGC